MLLVAAGVFGNVRRNQTNGSGPILNAFNASQLQSLMHFSNAMFDAWSFRPGVDIDVFCSSPRRANEMNESQTERRVNSGKVRLTRRVSGANNKRTAAIKDEVSSNMLYFVAPDAHLSPTRSRRCKNPHCPVERRRLIFGSEDSLNRLVFFGVLP